MRAAPLALRVGDRERLEGWLRFSTIQAGLAQRARIVLLAADGLTNVDIAGRVGVSLPTVTSWRTRYARSGIGGLSDEGPAGGPPPIDHPRVIPAPPHGPP